MYTSAVASALLAFSVIMWVFVPWAFNETVNRTTSQRLKDHMLESKVRTEEEINRIYSPKSWLYHSTNYFLFAGIFFVFAIFNDLSGSFIPRFYPGQPNIFILIGLFLIGAAMFEVWRIQEYVLQPAKLPKFTYKSFSSTQVARLGLLTLTAFDVFMITFFSYGAASDYSAFDAAFMVLFLLSLAFGVFLLRNPEYKEPITKRNFYVMGLYFLPWFLLIVLVVGNL